MNEDFEKEVESVSSELETGNDQVQAEELSGEMQDNLSPWLKWILNLRIQQSIKT